MALIRQGKLVCGGEVDSAASAEKAGAASLELQRPTGQIENWTNAFGYFRNMLRAGRFVQRAELVQWRCESRAGGVGKITLETSEAGHNA